jgi:hypothetical protein
VIWGEKVGRVVTDGFHIEMAGLAGLAGMLSVMGFFIKVSLLSSSLA